jgi:hypothetical protein
MAVKYEGKKESVLKTYSKGIDWGTTYKCSTLSAFEQGRIIIVPHLL